ncbi:MAG: hypothetical protein HUN04_11200 [Desulfobacter sp.]|nr:MAG: hypothetical protein HUN04_11200 [Desulfobacter sp.]
MLFGIFVEFIFEIGFYFIGYPIVKILTFGKYPKKKNSFLNDESNQNFYISAVGVLATAIVVIGYFVIKNR